MPSVARLLAVLLVAAGHTLLVADAASAAVTYPVVVDEWPAGRPPARDRGADLVAPLEGDRQPGNDAIEASDEELLKQERLDEPPIWLTVPFFGLFVGIGFYMLGMGLGSRTGFPVLFGSLFGGLPFLMSAAFGGQRELVILGTLAAAVFVAGVRGGRNGSSEMVRMFRGAAAHRKGWVSGRVR